MPETAGQEHSQNTQTKKRSRPEESTPTKTSSRRPKDFYKFDMTTLREPLLKAYYVAVVCEHSDKSWELELKTILEMRRDEILSKIQAFMEAVDCDWPWSDDVKDFIESTDNKGALQWKSDDDDQLAEVGAHFQQKIAAENKKLEAKSPGSRAGAIVRPKKKSRPTAPPGCLFQQEHDFGRVGGERQ